jgi:mRNA interferase YafQ
MLTLHETTRFKKNYKTMKKRVRDMSPLIEVIDTLLEEKPLSSKLRDHELKGEFAGLRECHLSPDWLFVYKIERDKLILVAFGTGSHSDIFR